MNVRITPRGAPQRTDLYSSIVRVSSDGRLLKLEGDPTRRTYSDAWFTLEEVAEIALDEDGAVT